MDALTEILQSMRLMGTVFCRAELDAPWAVHSGDLPKGIFHAIVDGDCWIEVEDGSEPVALSCGDVVFLPHGTPHVMSSDPNEPARPIAQLVSSPNDKGVGNLEIMGFGAHTSILCGSFQLERSDVHPLLNLLPPLIHVHRDDSKLATWLSTTLKLIQQELNNPFPGAQTVITRLTDVILIHALRSYISSLQPGEGDWLGGLKDPQVSRAMGLIHRSPEEPWTASTLATRVGMSRSSFFARFTELVGTPPHRYLTLWRMHTAANFLRSEPLSVAEIAERVGYSSEGAFSKAFKRLVGLAPSKYRQAPAMG